MKTNDKTNILWACLWIPPGNQSNSSDWVIIFMSAGYPAGVLWVLPTGYKVRKTFMHQTGLTDPQ